MALRSKITKYLRRFSVESGDIPTRAKLWALTGTPDFLIPIIVFAWTLFIYVFATTPRQAAASNMQVLFPSDNQLLIQCRVFLLFWNFALTEVDSAMAIAGSAQLNWELVGLKNFQQLAGSEDPAIILTAHMSNYDVASHLFAWQLNRTLHTVRAPEQTPQMQDLVRSHLEQLAAQGASRVHFNEPGSMLAVNLLKALNDGEVVAIQGDRADRSEATLESSLCGRDCTIPKGPFALAMAARCAIYPIFIVRSGYRRYRAVCALPIIDAAESTQRKSPELQMQLVTQWMAELEKQIHEHWQQWYVFQEVWPSTSK